MDFKALEAYKQIIFQTSDFQSLKAKYLDKEILTQQDINELLQIAIIDEQLAQFNYLISYSNSKTAGKADFDPEFQQHEKEECEHKHELIERLRTLNAPRLYDAIQNFPLINSNGRMWKQETSTTSVDILRNRLNEELGAIEFYKFVLQVIELVKTNTGEFDSTTYDLIKQIKADEQEHAKDLKDLLDQFDNSVQTVEVSLN